ncbi:FAD-binding oxidoreductase [Saccharospirillum salsuginis]|uniref:FAD-linked oxidase n=1 Tax=Saccharospirillum salsuginis TaxID=418750 RepID=A0A918N6P0_9GAMM|nr:FAD-binding oxidoreductase [Saccharospirillum salsuginis]GGX47151.1 FAD-linked oxidase [Saccharospirillum salsuginis]
MSNLNAVTLNGDATALADDAVTQLRAEFDGDVITPEHRDYDDARRVWNGEIDRRPALILRCRHAGDAATAVRFAARHELLTAVRGGGHNVGGLAVCDGGLVIDLSPMKGIELDAGQRRIRVDAGVTWAELDAATQKVGLAVPGGVVSTTGVAGLTLGGGIGWLRRAFGLSCDNVRALDVVTADGELRTLDARHEPELFSAIRGGGGNFGVVTRFEFDCHPVGPDVMFVAAFYPSEQGVDVLKRYRAFTETAPDAVSSFAICGTIPDEPDFPTELHGRDYVLIAACYAGEAETGARTLQPLRELGTPMHDMSDVMPFVDVQQLLDGDYPEGRHYYWKSLYMTALSDDAIEQVLSLAGERPSSLTTVDIWHLGGAMARANSGDTAFEHRAPEYLLGIESNWDDPRESDTNIDWTRQTCERMGAYAEDRGYLNFEPIDAEAIDKTYPQGYRRLRALKAQWDSKNLFRMNHNIKPG